MIKTDWRVVKSGTQKGKWDIETRRFRRVEKPEGGIGWEMTSNWSRHSVAASKRAAVCRAMLLKGRDEILSWEGGPVKLNPFATVFSS